MMLAKFQKKSDQNSFQARTLEIRWWLMENIGITRYVSDWTIGLLAYVEWRIDQRAVKHNWFLFDNK